jgi:hypothetical protein
VLAHALARRARTASVARALRLCARLVCLAAPLGAPPLPARLPAAPGNLPLLTSNWLVIVLISHSLQSLGIHSWTDHHQLRGPVHCRSGLISAFLASHSPHARAASLRLFLPGRLDFGHRQRLRAGCALVALIDSAAHVPRCPLPKRATGHYCPAGSGAFTNCPAGTYGSTTFLTTAACTGNCQAGACVRSLSVSLGPALFGKLTASFVSSCRLLLRGWLVLGHCCSVPGWCVAARSHCPPSPFIFDLDRFRHVRQRCGSRHPCLQVRAIGLPGAVFRLNPLCLSAQWPVPGQLLLPDRHDQRQHQPVSGQLAVQSVRPLCAPCAVPRGDSLLIALAFFRGSSAITQCTCKAGFTGPAGGPCGGEEC